MILPTAIFLAALAQGSAIKVRLVVDEPQAALVILKERQAGKPIPDSDWSTLFQTEGYKRLKDREAGMRRPFTDDDFKKFMLSDDLLKRADGLEKTLDAWQKVDVAKCGERSLSYLPKNAQLKASVYLLIKPFTNSFVWQIRENPAVMLYLDPATSPDELSMTIAHEFHHIGFESCCPSSEYTKWAETQPKPRQTALMWQGAFGEGFAVLAAAGGPVPNPIGPSKPRVKQAWDDGVAHLDKNMADLQQFFLDTLSGKLDEKAAEDRAGEFYGIQGPWYTVGYHMAVTIEQNYGREKLIECYLDPRKLLSLYNAAAKKINAGGGKLFLWSEDLLEKMGSTKPQSLIPKTRP